MNKIRFLDYVPEQTALKAPARADGALFSPALGDWVSRAARLSTALAAHKLDQAVEQKPECAPRPLIEPAGAFAIPQDALFSVVTKADAHRLFKFGVILEMQRQLPVGEVPEDTEAFTVVSMHALKRLAEVVDAIDGPGTVGELAEDFERWETGEVLRKDEGAACITTQLRKIAGTNADFSARAEGNRLTGLYANGREIRADVEAVTVSILEAIHLHAHMGALRNPLRHALFIAATKKTYHLAKAARANFYGTGLIAAPEFETLGEALGWLTFSGEELVIDRAALNRIVDVADREMGLDAESARIWRAAKEYRDKTPIRVAVAGWLGAQ